MQLNEALVVPFTGAWIEIHYHITGINKLSVAPFTGAWIEISSRATNCIWDPGRSLHGSVD